MWLVLHLELIFITFTVGITFSVVITFSGDTGSTNYLALFRRSCSLKIRFQTFSVVTGERSPFFLVSAPGLNTENCWIEYLSNMAKQGTWADGLIIQAVADKFHLKIHTVETNPGFAEFDVVQAISPSCEPRLIYLGHVGEYHYVSSVPVVQCPDTLEDQASISIIGKCKKRKLNDNNGQKRNKYMKELMRRKRKVTDQQTQSLKKNKGKSQKKPEMSLKKYEQKFHEKPEKSTISNDNNSVHLHLL